MKLKKCRVLLLAFLMLWPGAALAQEIQMAPYVTSEMSQANYWINKCTNPDQVLLTGDKISAFNQQCLLTSGTKMHDLANLSEPFDGIALAKSLSQFDIPSSTLYYNGAVLDRTILATAQNNILAYGASSQQYYQYGFGIKISDSKFAPLDLIISTSAADNESDVFQNSTVKVNEPVAIASRTADSKFYYVLTRDSYGWVRAEDIAVCSSKEEWLQAQQMADFLVVTGEKVWLEGNNVTSQFSEKALSMGTVLELADSSEISGLIDNRFYWNSYVVKMPYRNSDGSFCQKLALIPQNRDVSVGYLPYTRSNILQQAFKLLGNRYGWGGMLDAQDCSSLLQEVFSCFGFYLPRDTDMQEYMPVAKTNLAANLSLEARKAAFSNLQAGAILQLPGHTMLYLGENDGHYYVLNASGSLAAPAVGQSHGRIRTVIVNDLTVTLSNGTSWLQAINLIMRLE